MEPKVAILGVALLQWIVIVAISFFAGSRVSNKLIVSSSSWRSRSCLLSECGAGAPL